MKSERAYYRFMDSLEISPKGKERAEEFILQYDKGRLPNTLENHAKYQASNHYLDMILEESDLETMAA